MGTHESLNLMCKCIGKFFGVGATASVETRDESGSVSLGQAVYIDVAHPLPCPWSLQAVQAHTVSTSGDDSVVPDSGATPALPTPQARSEGAVHRASRSGGARSAKAEQAAAVAAAAASESAHGKAAAHFSHTQVTIVFLMLLASSFVTESIGIHAFFGAFLAGVIVPKEGPFVPMVGGFPPCFFFWAHPMACSSHALSHAAVCASISIPTT